MSEHLEEIDDPAPRTRPTRKSSAYQMPASRENVWFLGITTAAILCILFLLVRYVNTPLMLSGEQERPERLDPVRNPQLAAVKMQITEKSFPAGLGNGQLRLIGQPEMPPVPTGLGQQPMQFIGHPEIPVPTGLGQQPMQFIDARMSPGIGAGQMQLIQQNIPYLGVLLIDVPPQLTTKLKLVADIGVYVTGVVDGSPAQKAGVLAGDVLLKVNHIPITAPEDIDHSLVGKNPGDAVKILFNRGGVTKSAYITLG